MEEKMHRPGGLSGYHQRSGDKKSPGDRRDRPGQGLGRHGAVTAEAIEKHALLRLRFPGDFDHFYTPNNTYQVIMEVEPRFQRDPWGPVFALRPFPGPGSLCS